MDTWGEILAKLHPQELNRNSQLVAQWGGKLSQLERWDGRGIKS